MRAFQMHGIGQGSVEVVDEPRPREGEVLVEPILSGLCATDVHIFFEGALVRSFPLILGHETVGRVVDVRGAVDWSPYSATAQGVQAGDLVCVEPLVPCSTCHACLRGHPNLCAFMSHVGIWRDGCWAELVAVPALRAIRVHPELTSDQAVFVEPLACALNFLDRGGIGPGRSVFILGSGPAGLLTLQAAKAAGASPVIVSDPAEPRRRLASELGADLVVDPMSHDLQEEVDDYTEGLGCDMVVEVAGAPTAVRDAIAVARSGSSVVLAGICGGGESAIDTNAIVTKELTVMGALASRWHFDRAMKLLASASIDSRSLISRAAPWTEAGTMLEVAKDDLDVVKILLEHEAV